MGYPSFEHSAPRCTGSRQGIVGRLWQKKDLIAITLVAVLVPACATNQPEATTPEQSNVEQNNVSTSEVVNNPEQLIGKTVTIRSEPVRTLGPNSFTLRDEQFFGSEPILVVNATGSTVTLPTEADTEVQVTGEVRQFVLADLERDYRLGLQPEQYREYENKPVIIAQSIAAAPKPGEITQNPQQYYGQTLAVTGEVEDLQNANVFTLDEDQLLGATDLLVIQATPKAGSQQAGNQQAGNQQPIREGEKVAVSGVLRPFVRAEFERDYDLTLDQGIVQKLEAEYSNKPVLIAQEVYPSAIPQSAQ